MMDAALQNEDGAWGIYIEGTSSMFATGLGYVTFRLLGEAPDGGNGAAMERGSAWIRDRGGVTYIPSWGKFWLSVSQIKYSFDVTGALWEGV